MRHHGGVSFRVTYDPSDPGTPQYVDVRCSRTACNKPLPQQSISFPNSLQYDNNLVLDVRGGYGMFTDPMGNVPGVDDGRPFDPEQTLLLCHECAHEFAAWMGIDVSGWHTHVPADLGGTQHADHHH